MKLKYNIIHMIINIIIMNIFYILIYLIYTINFIIRLLIYTLKVIIKTINIILISKLEQLFSIISRILLITFTCGCIIIAIYNYKINVLEGHYIQFGYSDKDGLKLTLYQEDNNTAFITMYINNIMRQIEIQVADIQCNIGYKSIFDLINLRNLSITCRHPLIHAHCTMNNLRNSQITLSNIYAANGQIQMNCSIQDNIIYLISVYPNIRFEPIGLMIPTHDRLELTYNIQTSELKLRANNIFVSFCDKVLDIKVYAEDVRGSASINLGSNNIETNISLVTLELSKKNINEIIYIVNQIKSTLDMLNITNNGPARKIITNLNINNLKWQDNMIYNIYARACSCGKNVLSLTISAKTQDDDIALAFLNNNNEIEIYSTNIEHLLKFATKSTVCIGGMLQGVVDLQKMESRMILLNSDMQILAAKVLLTMLTTFRTLDSNTFMPISKINGFYNQDSGDLTFNFNASNNVNIFKIYGLLNFIKSHIDVDVSFATKAMLIKLFAKLAGQKDDDSDGIQNLHLRIYGDINNPSITKPVISTILYALLSFVLF